MGAVVPAFAEVGSAARIPGPLIRVAAGTEVALSLHNALARCSPCAGSTTASAARPTAPPSA